MISIIVAIDSDGTVNQQDDVTNSLVLARPNDEEFMGEFEQDSNNFQLYHYIFSPLQRKNMGQYVIYSGISVNIYLVCTYTHMLHFSDIYDEQLLNIVIEINITTEGDALKIHIASYRYTQMLL